MDDEKFWDDILAPITQLEISNEKAGLEDSIRNLSDSFDLDDHSDKTKEWVRKFLYSKLTKTLASAQHMSDFEFVYNPRSNEILLNDMLGTIIVLKRLERYNSADQRATLKR